MYLVMLGRFVMDYNIFMIDKKNIGRFILWLKGVINYIGMWFDSSDLFNFNNNLRMDLILIY